MKLFTKDDNAKLFANYSKGSDMANQNVVVKIFNPYGRGTWFIMNSDPNDPDYLWGIVDLGYGAEVGSISRSDLENYRNRFGLGFERDTSFSPINAREVFKGLQNGEFFVNGGRLLSPKQRYIAELKGLTGLRQKAIEDYIEENNLTSDEVLHIVIGLGRKQISGSDVSTAIVGKKNNSESKKLLAFAKSDKALKAEYGAFMDNVYAGGGSFREKRNKYLEKLGNKEAKIWDKIGASSGSEIRENEALLKKYADSVEEMLQKEGVGKGSFDREDYYFYTDENWHLFNDFLVWNRYYDPTFTDVQKAWRKKSFKEEMKKYKKAKYVANPNVINVSSAFSTKVNPKYILRSDIESVTVKKAGKEVTYSGTDVFNGANMLKSGGDLKSKGNYISKANVVSVKLKSGKEVKPANGYWVKKGATPISNQKFDGGGDTDEGVDLFEDYENIPPKVQAVLDKYEDAFEDGDYDGLNKAVKELNEIGYTFDFYVDGQAYDLRKIGQKGKSEFEEYEMGGKTTFAQKSSAIAKKFVGKAVEPKYQKEYGKRYDAKEAKEVGNKIAGKQKASYNQKYMDYGGDFPDYGETVSGEDIDYDMKDYFNRTNKKLLITTKDKKQHINGAVTKFYNDLIFVAKDKHDIPVKDILKVEILKDNTANVEKPKKSMKSGGSVKSDKLKQVTQKAKEIRKEGEKWQSAMKRAYAMMK